jgi:hypothetical protein
LPITRDRVIKAVRRAQRVAGIEQGVHILRHTFCSHLAMKGAPARAIQELAGYADLSTTQRYMHLSAAATSAFAATRRRRDSLRLDVRARDSSERAQRVSHANGAGHGAPASDPPSRLRRSDETTFAWITRARKLAQQPSAGVARHQRTSAASESRERSGARGPRE